MSELEIKPKAQWTNDCCGKKDFDGPIISLSTRYWPKGGSAMVLDTSDGQGLRQHDDGSRASAKSALHLDLQNGDYLVLIDSGYIEGDSEEEVKSKTEKWAQEQMAELVTLLRTKYTLKTWDDKPVFSEKDASECNRLAPVRER